MNTNEDKTRRSDVSGRSSAPSGPLNIESSDAAPASSKGEKNERAMDVTATSTNVTSATGSPNVRARSETLNGGLDPSEMGRRSGEARREKKQLREERAEENALTFRQRLGVSLSKLTQTDLDRTIEGLAQSGRPADLRALAALADQAFGKPQVAEDDTPLDDELAQLTRKERAALRAILEDADPERELGELAHREGPASGSSFRQQSDG
jgi:hypothetical protein